MVFTWETTGELSHVYLSTANFRSDVRNPKTIFSCQAALTKVKSTCPLLISDVMSGNPKTIFSFQAALTEVMSTCQQLILA